MRQYYLLVLFVFILAGCKQHSGFVVSTPDVTPICTLQENLGLLGRVTSFDLCDDSSFVLISNGNSNIYTYSMAGAQKQCLNKSGRALYEYVTPTLVRADGEGNLYLWCSDSQKFISYDAAGTPRLAFKYPSAVYDFLPLSDQVLAVYTAGRRHGNVIDLLDGNNGTVLDTLVQSSEAHYMLTSALGRGAMSLSDKGRFVFMPKDALTVYEVPADRGRPEKSAVFQSPTFSCDPMETSFNGDIQKLLKFLNTTPSTLLVMKKGRTIWVLTQEGAVKENNGAGGKYSTNDASAEVMGYLRGILKEADVPWQVGELGKTDVGGGGTIAVDISIHNLDTVDMGVPVLSMHAPLEVTSKADDYLLYKAIYAYYNYKKPKTV